MKWILFLVLPLVGCGCGNTLVVRKSASGIGVEEKGRSVLFYQVQPLKMDGRYERAGYVHPLNDLEGLALTEDGPRDHPYHRGIFWAWHQVLRNGQTIADGWVSEHIVFRPVTVDARRDRHGATLSAELLWRVGEENVLRERTRIRVYPAERHFRLVDFEIHLVPLVDSLALGGAEEKGYGGFCLRLQLPADIAFWSQGDRVRAQDVAVAAGPWMDFQGSVNGRRRGVAVFCKPSGKPHRWILRKRSSMQNAVFPGKHAEMLSKEGWLLKYRVVVHDGSVSQAQLESLYRRYAQL
ncbi:DUF6807 family protein [Chitinophaga lutea]